MPVPGLHPCSRGVSVDSDSIPREATAPLVDESYAAVIPDDQCSKGGSGLVDVLNFNASTYDLTIQTSCLVVYSHWHRAGIVNLVCTLLLQLLNIYLQITVVFEVEKLVALPAMAHVQELYDSFTEHCYGTDPQVYTYSADVDARFESWDPKLKEQLCRYPLTSPMFFLILLVIWTLFLAHELKQTAYFAWQTLTLGRPSQGHVTLSESAGGDVIITHLGGRVKVWIAVVVFLPKFAIAIILWYVGARWLTATPGIDNLVLNSLALTFICELDELLFRTCTSESTKTVLEKTKLPITSNTQSVAVWNSVEMVATCFVCIALAYLYLHVLQDAIPGYRWDLDSVCSGSAHFVFSSHAGHRR